MSGFGDKVKNAVLDMVPGDAARKVSSAMNGHTTSGMDQAMQAQADKLHPTVRLPKPVVKPAAGYSLKLPSDSE